MKILEVNLKKEIAEIRVNTETNMKILETNLKKEIAISKVDTIKWVAGMLLAQAAIIATLIKLL